MGFSNWFFLEGGNTSQFIYGFSTLSFLVEREQESFVNLCPAEYHFVKSHESFKNLWSISSTVQILFVCVFVCVSECTYFFEKGN